MYGIVRFWSPFSCTLSDVRFLLEAWEYMRYSSGTGNRQPMTPPPGIKDRNYELIYYTLSYSTIQCSCYKKLIMKIDINIWSLIVKCWRQLCQLTVFLRHPESGSSIFGSGHSFLTKIYTNVSYGQIPFPYNWSPEIELWVWIYNRVCQFSKNISLQNEAKLVQFNFACFSETKGLIFSHHFAFSFSFQI